MSGYYNTDINAESIVGSITNRGAISQSLNASGSYTIPAGYHNGSGRITANTLSSQTSADAVAGNILATKTAWVNGSQITGSMTNQGSKSTSLNAGGSYTIPSGYHDGTGKVTANTLASQTAGTAAAGHILSGKTAWVGGSRLTGTLAVQNISSVTATMQSSSVIRISWKNPAKGPYTGVKIFMSTSGNPGTSGTAKYTGTGSSTTASGTSYVDITGLSAITKYYFTVCAYVTNVGNGTSFNVNATTKAAAGSQTFTSSGTFTVPTGVTSIDIFCVGGGGAAGSYMVRSSGGGAYTAGAGGGYTATKKAYAVTPGASFTVTIGAGGTAVKSSADLHGTAAATGGTTSFGSVVSAAGGKGTCHVYSGGSLSVTKSMGAGGAGGSGGGARGGSSSGYNAGAGGSNGSNGGSGTTSSYTCEGGTGQGTTTRAYGETSGTLYAGGGGGGAYGSANPGAAGDGGGAAGKGYGFDGVNGTANTGGGGGGIATLSSGAITHNGGSGGSGICLVRWS